MNEFKFLCPHCQQSIEATPEYCGAQINCPSCHTSIVVPDASTPPPMRPGKLTKAASTVHYAATTPAMAAALLNGEPAEGWSARPADVPRAVAAITIQ